MLLVGERLHDADAADILLDARVEVADPAEQRAQLPRHLAADSAIAIQRDQRHDQDGDQRQLALTMNISANAPMNVITAMNTSSGPWCATSPISSRSFVTRATRWPVFWLS